MYIPFNYTPARQSRLSVILLRGMVKMFTALSCSRKFSFEYFVAIIYFVSDDKYKFNFKLFRKYRQTFECSKLSIVILHLVHNHRHILWVPRHILNNKKKKKKKKEKKRFILSAIHFSLRTFFFRYCYVFLSLVRHQTSKYNNLFSISKNC